MKETSIERIVGEEKCTLYTSERKFISPKKKRVLTEEERKAIGERLKRARDMLD